MFQTTLSLDHILVKVLSVDPIVQKHQKRFYEKTPFVKMLYSTKFHSANIFFEEIYNNHQQPKTCLNFFSKQTGTDWSGGLE